MQLGLCEYKAGDGWLAREINAKWARFEANLSDGVPDLRADIDDARTNGLRPIVDCRTTVEALADILYGAGDPEHNKIAAVNLFTDQIVEFCDLHGGIDCIEVWGSAEVAYIAQGRGMALDYSTILQLAYAAIKDAMPGAEVWTGGFGSNCLPDFIELGLSRYAPHSFDCCNWHPFIDTCGWPEADVQTCAIRLSAARRLIDERCDGQPFAASGFGLPTVQGRPRPEYGRFRRLPNGGCRGIPEDEAAQWATPLLDMFDAHGFRALCWLVRDRKPRWMHDFCGLLRRDGTPKAHLEAVARWGHEHGAN